MLPRLLLPRPRSVPAPPWGASAAQHGQPALHCTGGGGEAALHWRLRPGSQRCSHCYSLANSRTPERYLLPPAFVFKLACPRPRGLPQAWGLLVKWAPRALVQAPNSALRPAKGSTCPLPAPPHHSSALMARGAQGEGRGGGSCHLHGPWAGCGICLLCRARAVENQIDICRSPHPLCIGTLMARVSRCRTAEAPDVRPSPLAADCQRLAAALVPTAALGTSTTCVA